MSAWPATGGLDPFPSEVPPLTCALAMKAGGAPVGVAMVQNSCIVLLPGELRASCQQTAMLPERRLTAILGKNWLRPGASSLTRMGGLLQIAPSVSEKRSMMSVSALPGATASV